MINVTSYEQSQRLIKVGISEESASYCLTNQSNYGVEYVNQFHPMPLKSSEHKELLSLTIDNWEKYWEVLPAWSLTDLLDIAPSGELHCYKKTTRTLYQYEPTVGWIQPSHFCQNPIDAVVEVVERYYSNAKFPEKSEEQERTEIVSNCVKVATPLLIPEAEFKNRVELLNGLEKLYNNLGVDDTLGINDYLLAEMTVNFLTTVNNTIKKREELSQS